MLDAAIITDFMNFANSLKKGVVIESWKANGMIFFLKDIPAIKEDKKRLHKYVTDNLAKKGFDCQTVEHIVDYLSEAKL